MSGRNISLNDNSNIINHFVNICAAFPKIFDAIAETYKNPIIEKLKQKPELHAQSTFLYFKNPKDYISLLDNALYIHEISKTQACAEKIVQFSKSNGCYMELLNSFICGFIKSNSYNSADNRFSNLIAPYLDDMDRKMILKLLLGIQNNQQLYGRGKAESDHVTLKKRCDTILGKSFDYSDYDNFISRIKEDMETPF